MTNRYRGTLYTGRSANLAMRVALHREGRGSQFCAEHGLTRLVWAEFHPTIEDAMDNEKRIKRWRRAWKCELIEKLNPDWDDLFDSINA